MMTDWKVTQKFVIGFAAFAQISQVAVETCGDGTPQPPHPVVSRPAGKVHSHQSPAWLCPDDSGNEVEIL